MYFFSSLITFMLVTQLANTTNDTPIILPQLYDILKNFFNFIYCFS